ncbi:hypothetical protein LTR84_004249 [Exophiala bonariae]|uniref:Zn(2)-C6 fungal-type domain-containing protein n=1 Tax=Exophiala bonariae TaxID=1690606 RepID=A0AAV9N443_9EURO|nr:hypothetical protein LTR84_004249 [Exophiala bonariae]
MLQLKRRKACDFCYRRRIKCDAQKPRCSNCILHDSTCAFEAVSRKAKAKHRESGQVIDILRSQVERLESSLSQALEKIEELRGHATTLDEPPEALSIIASPMDFHEDQVHLGVKEHPKIALALPPLNEVLSAAEVYLTTLNTILPLFHPGRLLQLINSWYTHPGRRERTAWAAINVMLALAHSRISPNDGPSNENATFYLNNAQSVLSEVIMGEGDLLNVQILVGMVLILQGMQDLKPAIMLIAIALRLAHELGLHRRKPESLNKSKALEQDRVFWIAYLLDRDIGLRSSRPPVQREADIDLEWPSSDPEDGAGNVTTSDGTFPFNFLRCRVRLARIQGEVYDFIVTTRAGKTDNYQRDDNIIRLNRMLDDWISTIPLPFRPSSVIKFGQPNLCRSFAILYSTHIACRTQVCQAHAMALPWIQNLRGFGRTLTQQGQALPIPLPTPSFRDWEKLVAEIRGFMQLFRQVNPRDQAFIG